MSNVIQHMRKVADQVRETIQFARDTNLGDNQWNPNAGSFLYHSPQGGEEPCVAGMGILQDLRAQGKALQPNQAVIPMLLEGEPILALATDPDDPSGTNLSQSIHEVAHDPDTLRDLHAGNKHTSGIPIQGRVPRFPPGLTLQPLSDLVSHEGVEKAENLNNFRELALSEIARQHIEREGENPNESNHQELIQALDGIRENPHKHFKGVEAFEQWSSQVMDETLPDLEKILEDASL